MIKHLVFAALLLFSPATVFADHIHHLSFNAPSETSFELEVANFSEDSGAVLIEFFNHKSQEMQNKVFELKAFAQKSIGLEDIKSVARGMRIQSTENLAIKALSTYAGQTSAYPLAKHASSSLIIDDLSAGFEKLHLYNPTHEATRVELSHGESLFQEVYIHGKESLSIDLSEYSVLATQVRIASNVKLVASVSRINDSGKIDIRLAKADRPLPFEHFDSTKRYFLMSSGVDSDSSYVVALDNQKLIDQALEQIRDPRTAKILIGKVAAGHGNFNREFGHPSSSFWSWHISEALEFTDFGAQKCDGDPQLIEDVLPYWMQAVGSICFWNYRIQRELKFEELQTGLLK